MEIGQLALGCAKHLSIWRASFDIDD